VNALLKGGWLLAQEQLINKNFSELQGLYKMLHLCISHSHTTLQLIHILSFY
jgi:hypothetical protein